MDIGSAEVSHFQERWNRLINGWGQVYLRKAAPIGITHRKVAMPFLYIVGRTTAGCSRR
jgi:hypothetical protein